VKVTIRVGRQRELFGVALKLYDALAKGTQANLGSLNLPTMHVDTARAQNEAWKEKLANTANELEITDDLRIHAKDAINFVLNSKYNKAEKQQIELLIDTQSTEQTINELKALRRKFSTQPDLELPEGASPALEEEPPARPSEEGVSELRQAALVGAE
jgi:uncharacterized protein YPO0396